MDKLEKVFTSIEELNKHFKNEGNKSVIMFADLTDSTLYKQKRSFVSGLIKTKLHNEAITEIVRKYGGRIVKYIGDGVMCEFSVEKNYYLTYKSINAAIEIIEYFTDYNQDISDELEKIKTKIGIAFGTVAYFYGDDPQGHTVDLASRIESIAKPNQILVQKKMLDCCDLSKIESRIGKALKYTENDYVSDSIKLRLKGIEFPQEVVEIKTEQSFVGIKEENEYNEYWENYRFEAYLWKLDEEFINNEYIKENYFKIVYDLRYETVLKKDILKFVCVRDIEELNVAMHETNLFSRYMLPVSKDIIENISQIYKTDFVEINDVRLDEIQNETLNESKYYFTQCFTGRNIAALVGKKVSVRYRITTVINKFAHFYTMVTEYPIQNLSMSFDVGDTDIIKIWPIDCFSSGNIPKYTYTPSKERPKKIEVTVGRNEWIYPRSGVTFVWRLDCERNN